MKNRHLWSYPAIDTSPLDPLLDDHSPKEREEAIRLLFRYVEMVIEVVDRLDEGYAEGNS